MKTNVGEIMGFKENISVDGEQRLISKFLGIPYAESTAGPMRFRKPVPKAPFKSIFDARHVPLACYQQNMEGKETMLYYGAPGFSEDCLTLNIYVPHGFQTNDMVPVMIWIHGGGFTQGTASMYNPEVLALFGNIIVVTINYRLGMFGFLRDKNGIFSGNQGLWDQHLAIKWVHDNIEMFYGYKNEITIFGESAGSASVLLQAIYPGNKGLFKRVIAESGAALAYWAVKDISSFEAYFTEQGCLPSAKSFVSCLQSKDPAALQSNITDFAPVVDGEFLIDTPKEILDGNATKTAEARDFFGSLDIMVGLNDKDGAIYFELIAEQLGYNDYSFDLTTDVLKKQIVPYFVDTVLSPKNNGTRKTMEQMLTFLYTNWDDPDDTAGNRNRTIDMATDFAFAVAAIQTAMAHVKLQRGTTYFYEFAVEVEHNLLTLPPGVKGSNHADEVPYVFGLYLLKNVSIFRTGPFNHTPEEKLVSRATMTFWTNFAKSGNPNFPMDVFQFMNTSWPEFTMTTQHYLQMTNQLSPASVMERFHPRRMAFWSDVLPQLESLKTQPDIIHFDPSPSLVG